MDKKLLNQRKRLLAKAKKLGLDGKRLYRKNEKQIRHGNVILGKQVRRLEYARYRLRA